MKRFIPHLFLLGFLFCNDLLNSQETKLQEEEKALLFEEYLGYVKQYHPLLKQANLNLTMAEANLLKARGGFDPKIAIDYDRKKFKDTEYFDQLNATFKIPTWYGIEFKANFEENSGAFLNPNLTVPEDGLYAAGVSFSLAQGLLINDRMAMLKKAHFFREQTKADRDLLVNELVFEATKAYLQWVEATNEQKIYQRFLENAARRFQGVQRSIEAGDKAAIDATEARITLQNRQLSLEAATLKRRKTALQISNFLWINDVPLELQDNIYPIAPKISTLEASLMLEGITNPTILLTDHPKIRSLNYKIDGLEVDRNLKMNKLLPKLQLQYNFLSTTYSQIDTFNTANYKTALTFSMPLFLRKERGDLRLAKAKLAGITFEREATSLRIQNKINAVTAEITSLKKQNSLITTIVSDYTKLVAAEERKFSLGESSLFLINSREKSLIQARIKENTLAIKLLRSSAKLFNVMGLGIERSMEN